MLCHLFHHIDRFIRSKKDVDTDRKDSISKKKLGQGYGAWSTRNTFLGWDLDTIAHLLRLTPRQQEKVTVALEAIHSKAHSTC